MSGSAFCAVPVLPATRKPGIAACSPVPPDSVTPTIRCPFDALASEDEFLLLTGIGENPQMTERKARIVGNISRVTEKKSVIFIQQKTSLKEIEGTPLITKDELRKADDSDDVIELILQREKRKKE